MMILTHQASPCARSCMDYVQEGVQEPPSEAPPGSEDRREGKRPGFSLYPLDRPYTI